MSLILQCATARIVHSPDITSSAYTMSIVSRSRVISPLTALEAHFALEQSVEGCRVLARECAVDLMSCELKEIFCYVRLTLV